MNTENQIPNIPTPGENEASDLKETASWIINVLLKVGAGYLAKVILDALGFKSRTEGAHSRALVTRD